jgi:hypothetical protein
LAVALVAVFGSPGAVPLRLQAEKANAATAARAQALENRFSEVMSLEAP